MSVIEELHHSLQSFSYNACISPSDGSANVNSSHFDLISVLVAAQTYGVDFFDVSWQPALEDIGLGGTAHLSQRILNLRMSYVFKRSRNSPDSSGSQFGSEKERVSLQAIAAEILVLTHPLVREHPNVIDLEGICWEIFPDNGKVLPVLIFERARYGDLRRFMNSEIGQRMDIRERLKLCGDIVSAVMLIHECNCTHGDITPGNVLVFENDSGGFDFKVSDLGFAASFNDSDDHQLVTIPRSRPWNAPEFFDGGRFTISQAKKMDLYSLGMLCLWVLFQDQLSEPSFCSQTGHGTPHSCISFLEPYKEDNVIEDLKQQDQLRILASIIIQNESGLSKEEKIGLSEFLELTLDRDPKKRDFSLLDSVNSTAPLCRTSSPPERRRYVNIEGSPCTPVEFQISKMLNHLSSVDFRVRKHILECLEVRVKSSPNSSHTVAFQLSLCYSIGFGVPLSEEKANFFLDVSGKYQDDLETEKHRVKIEAIDWKVMNQQAAKAASEGFLVRFEPLYQGKELCLAAESILLQEIHDLEISLGDGHILVYNLRLDLMSVLNSEGRFVESCRMARKMVNDAENDSLFGPEHEMTLLAKQRLSEYLANSGQLAEAVALQEGILEKSSNIDDPRKVYRWSGAALLANFYRQLGQWDKAIALDLQVTKAQTEVLGVEHPSTIETQLNLSSTYRDQNMLEEARILGCKVVEMAEKVMGTDHHLTIDSLSNLALTYREQRRWNDAENLQLRVIDWTERILGEGHSEALMSKGNLAATYADQARWADAEAIQVQVVDQAVAALGVRHPITLQSKASLAITYRETGRGQEAENVQMEIYEIFSQVLGREHPDTLIHLSSLSTTQSLLGKFDQALRTGLRVMEDSRTALREGHPTLLLITESLATAYVDMGRFDEAEEIQIRARDAAEQALGQEHPRTLSIMGNLAATKYSQGHLEEAEKLEVHVLKERKRLIGEGHPDTLLSMINLAATYLDQKRLTEAETLFFEALKLSKKSLGPEHINTLTATSSLAATYNCQERFQEAERLYLDVIPVANRTLGDENPETIAMLGGYVLTLRWSERLSEAEKLATKVWQLYRKVLGDQHPETLIAKGSLALTYQDQERFPEAEAMFLEVLEARKNVLGELHPETLTTADDLAMVYNSQNRFEDAEDILVSLVERRKDVLGPDYCETLKSMENLVAAYRGQGRLDEADQLQAEVDELEQEQSS